MKSTFVYDGDCAFCRCWVAVMRRFTGEAMLYRPSQEAAPEFPTIPPAAFEEAVQWIGDDGEVLDGADAVFRALEAARWPLCRLGAWVRRVPGGMGLCRWGYRFVAHRRAFFSRWTRCFCQGRG